MGLLEYTFSDRDFTGKNVQALDDTPKMDAQALKAWFDSLSETVIAPRFNAVLAALASSGGAACIGAAPSAVLPGATVQEQLTAALDNYFQAITTPGLIPYYSITVDKLAPNICFDLGGYGNDGMPDAGYNPYDFANAGSGLDAYAVPPEEEG